MPRWVEKYPKGYRVKRKGHPTQHLGGPDASRAEIWIAYEQWEQSQHGQALTVADLIDLYLQSPAYTHHISRQTQTDYLRYANKIRAVFGAMLPDAINAPTVQLYMDMRGKDYPTAANRERTFLSILLKWGKARGMVTTEDPTLAVKPLKEGQGGRYVDDKDYTGFYDWLEQGGHTAHLVAMEISYLCAARQQDVLALTRRNKLPEGLLVAQQKTGKQQVKLWSERLRDAVELGLSGSHDLDAAIVRSKRGQPYTRDGFNSVWLREQKKALAAGKISARFRFHDLKVKAISDFEGDKQQFSGHKTQSMVQRYNRTADKVVTINKARIKGE